MTTANKKAYVRPTMICEQFTPNEYVAACGDEHKVYLFKCDAQAGTLYADTEGKLGKYRPCGKTHEASVSETFVDGYVDYNKNGKKDNGEEVKVWIEYAKWLGQSYVRNAHATTLVDMNSWQTAKS
ncbi:MAG: hypothetical protein MR303_12505 [Emergencia sp.]|nr:hypothetical protein [Emergencia sp.]